MTGIEQICIRKAGTIKGKLAAKLIQRKINSAKSLEEARAIAASRLIKGDYRRAPMYIQRQDYDMEVRWVMDTLTARTLNWKK